MVLMPHLRKASGVAPPVTRSMAPKTPRRVFHKLSSYLDQLLPKIGSLKPWTAFS
jgi:hypothetical protein